MNLKLIKSEFIIEIVEIVIQFVINMFELNANRNEVCPIVLQLFVMSK